MADVMEEKVVTGGIYLLNMKGDAKFTWNKDVPAEVTAARNFFNELKASNRYLSYEVEPGGGRGAVIREFDPEAQAIIMAPQNQGG